MLAKNITKHCEYCDSEFFTSKLTAKYCCSSCRTKANTWRRENEKSQADTARKKAELADKRKLSKSKRDAEKAKPEIAPTEDQYLIEIEQKIQAEIDAFELGEKNKGIISIIDNLKVYAVKKEQQYNADLDQKKKEKQIQLEKGLDDARLLGKGIGMAILGALELFGKSNNASSASIKPGLTSSSIQHSVPEKTGQPGPNNPSLSAPATVHKSVPQSILDMIHDVIN